jgi:hypothetical protein
MFAANVNKSLFSGFYWIVLDGREWQTQMRANDVFPVLHLLLLLCG